MKTKFITLGYGVILATCLVKADDEREIQPLAPLRYITEILQVQLSPNPADNNTYLYCFHVDLLKRQFLAFKYLCVLLG